MMVPSSVFIDDLDVSQRIRSWTHVFLLELPRQHQILARTCEKILTDESHPSRNRSATQRDHHFSNQV